MNSFEAMGAARLQAAEGQRQLAAIIARATARALLRTVDLIGRNLPEGKSTPW